jgi:hypothetical protein
MTPQAKTKPLKHYRWRSIQADPTCTALYFDTWIEPSGELHNPHHYPPEQAYAAALRADQRKDEKLAESRRRGVEKRRRRREAQIHQAALRILRNEGIGHQTRCCCCGKYLTDPQSISRAIGSECWEHVLRAVEKLEAEREAQTNGDAR